MQSVIRAVIVLILLIPAGAIAAIWPDTTLTKETANNTSAPSSFLKQANGNAAPGNVSDVPLRRLLYPETDTVILAHFMTWFGGSNHMNVGYRSDDYAQVSRQFQDMKRRGIDGVILDWYGQSGNREEQTARYVRGYANSYLDVRFAMMENVGALDVCAATAGCDLTNQLIADLRNLVYNYCNVWGYLRVDGRPVIFLYGMEKYALDWNRVRDVIGSAPLLIFRDANGFSSAASSGAYAWLYPIASDYANYESIPYLEDFYSVASDHPNRLPVGSAFKGFNDISAAWAPPGGRHIEQFCGQTWLDSLAVVSRYYSSNNQLPVLQLVTWNNYEEGTEIETGIDNCFSLTASATGNTVNWTTNGPEQTIDSYRVFISEDGEQLATLGNVPAGKRNFDLSAFGLSPGTYRVYVKAIGKPSILNHMSNAAVLTIGTPDTPPTDPPPTDPPPTDPPPTDPPDPDQPDDPGEPTDPELNVSVLPSVITVQQGQNAMANVTIVGSSHVQLICANMPENASCTFGPAVSSAASSTSTLTIRTSQTVRVSGLNSRRFLAVSFITLFAFVFTGVRSRRVLASGLLVVLAISMVACGSGGEDAGSASHPELVVTPKGEFTIGVKALYGNKHAVTNVTLVVK